MTHLPSVDTYVHFLYFLIVQTNPTQLSKLSHEPNLYLSDVY